MIWVAGGLSFLVWMWNSYQAKGVDDINYKSDSVVKVGHTKDLISFVPTGLYKKVLIFYPGGMVEPDAYVPLCRRIANRGYKVLLIKMPWRLAIKGYRKPKEMNLFADTTKRYILAGHSQGAKMAAQFVYENPGLADQLILMGTTHPRDINLSKSLVAVMKISASNDGIAAVDEINNNKSKLPSSTKYVLIEGANHSQFGYYGFQLGDNKPGITRDVQQQIILDNILAFTR